MENITSKMGIIKPKKIRKASEEISNNHLKMNDNDVDTHNPIFKALHHTAAHSPICSAFKDLHDHSSGTTTNNR
jgi:hypothetical protein